MPSYADSRHRKLLKALGAAVDHPATNQKVGSSTLSGRATLTHVSLMDLDSDSAACFLPALTDITDDWLWNERRNVKSESDLDRFCPPPFIHFEHLLGILGGDVVVFHDPTKISSGRCPQTSSPALKRENV